MKLVNVECDSKYVGKIVDVLLKNNIVTIGNVDNLVESKKISIDNYLELKDKYKEEYND